MAGKRIAVNGLVQVGNLVLRDLAARGGLNSVVVLNNTTGTVEQHAQILEFDRFMGAGPQIFRRA